MSGNDEKKTTSNVPGTALSDFLFFLVTLDSSSKCLSSFFSQAKLSSLKALMSLSKLSKNSPLSGSFSLKFPFSQVHRPKLLLSWKNSLESPQQPRYLKLKENHPSGSHVSLTFLSLSPKPAFSPPSVTSLPEPLQKNQTKAPPSLKISATFLF